MLAMEGRDDSSNQNEIKNGPSVRIELGADRPLVKMILFLAAVG